MEKCVSEYGSEYDWNSNEQFLLPAGIRQNMFSSAQKYRSGRDVLRAVAKACRNSCSRVLLPALCCESMVTPFSAYGITPVFYRLNIDYTADYEDVMQKLTEDSVLLYAPYFGITPFEKELLQEIRMKYERVLLVEDRTQDILRSRTDGFAADVVVASIRKWMALPDGGVLWSRKLRFEAGSTDTAFAQLRTQALKGKSVYLSTGEPAQKEAFRKMLSDASEMLDVPAEPVAMAEESAQILDRLDLKKLFDRRQENVTALQAALEPALRSGKLKKVTNIPQASTLYYPVITENQAQLQKRLAEQGIYCPVIWPVPEGAKGICHVADYTASHMLAVPCDHRYTPEEMTYIGSEIVRICDEL